MQLDKSPSTREQAPTKFVLTHLLPTVLRAASKCGVNVLDFVLRAGLSPLTLIPGHGDLPVREMFRLLNEGTLAGWQAKPGGHLPVLFAQSFQFDYLSDATGYLSSCSDLAQASKLFNWVAPLICPPATLEQHENQHWTTAVLVLDEAVFDADVSWTLSETILCTWFRLCQDLTHQRLKPLRVEFRHPPHVMRERCDALFGVECEFGATRDAITLRKSDTTVPLPSALPILNQYSRDRLKRVLDFKEVDPDWSKHNASLEMGTQELPSITRRLLDHYNEDPRRVTEVISDVAMSVQMPTRTLQRRLKEAGTSFSKVQAKARLLIAKERLLDPNRSLDDIARMLGFPDRRSFAVFYKRMTGMTPREWRRLHDIHT